MGGSSTCLVYGAPFRQLPSGFDDSNLSYATALADPEPNKLYKFSYGWEECDPEIKHPERDDEDEDEDEKNHLVIGYFVAEMWRDGMVQVNNTVFEELKELDKKWEMEVSKIVKPGLFVIGGR
jgi:hypothetical protein